MTRTRKRNRNHSQHETDNSTGEFSASEAVNWDGVSSNVCSTADDDVNSMTDGAQLWKYVMVLILDRYYRLTDMAIAKERDRLNNYVPENGCPKLLMEFGSFQMSISKNVEQLEKSRRTAKERFISNLLQLTNGVDYSGLPPVDMLMTVTELEELVTYYSYTDTLFDSFGGEDSAISLTTTKVDEISDAEYVFNLLEPIGTGPSQSITRTAHASISNAESDIAGVRPNMFPDMPPLSYVAPDLSVVVDVPSSLIYEDSAVVNCTSNGHPLDIGEEEENTAAGDEYIPGVSTPCFDDGRDDDEEWQTVRKKTKQPLNSTQKVVDEKSLETTRAPTPMENGKFQGQGVLRRKTEMCRLYQEGKCKWGDRCNYAHSQDELNRAPEAEPMGSSVIDNSALKAKAKKPFIPEDPTPAGNIKFKGEHGERKRKTEICENFKAGKCRWGEECNYAHSAEELKRDDDSIAPTSNTLPISDSTYHTIMKMEDPTPGGNKKFRGSDGERRRKTEMCKNFQLGKCGWGKACNYAHDVNELKDIATNGVGANNTTSTNTTSDIAATNQASVHHGRAEFSTIGKKLLMCVSYSEGRCKWPADECKYAHHPDELDPKFAHIEPCTDQQCAGRLRYERRRINLCSHTMQGESCKFGSTCTYAHTEAELRQLPKHEICQRHAQGRCMNGENCVYAHSKEELRPDSPIPNEANCEDETADGESCWGEVVCSICSGVLEEGKTLVCGHDRWHEECIVEWMREKGAYCPCCYVPTTQPTHS